MIKDHPNHDAAACPPIRRLGIIKRIIPFLLLAVALAGGAQAGTVVTVPTDLNPGDQYRLVFVTNGTRDAQSTDIADYNTFVTTEANLSTELAALGTRLVCDRLDQHRQRPGQHRYGWRRRRAHLSSDWRGSPHRR